MGQNFLGYRDDSAVQKLFDQIRIRRIGVIGDVVLDIALNGSINRFSNEAPIPVIDVDRELATLGGAGNVARQLRALGQDVRLCGVCGEDQDGAKVQELISELGDRANVMVNAPLIRTMRKTRLLQGHYHIARFDNHGSGCGSYLPTAVIDVVTDHARKLAEWSDALVLSDYSGGVLTTAVCEAAILHSNGKPVIVDPAGDHWERYAGATLIKPNLREASEYTGLLLDSDAAIEQALISIGEVHPWPHIVITRGREGMSLASRHDNLNRPMEITHVRAREQSVYDVTGAGDVVAAVLAMSLAAGADAVDCCALANLAAGVKIQRPGSAVVRPEDLAHNRSTGPVHLHIDKHAPPYASKLIDMDHLSEAVDRLRERGLSIVLTNGCFDLFHAGHAEYLEQSRAMGDWLIVGVNSDASVRANKGVGHPYHPLEARLRVLESLRCVDQIVVFDEPTPEILIETVRPRFYTKGGDYDLVEGLPGVDLVASLGGESRLIPVRFETSSSAIARAVSELSDS